MASPTDVDVSFDIQELVRDVILFRETYENRREGAQVARMLETTACNDLMAAEKALDAKIKELKDAAPPGSHWHNESLPRFTVNKA